MDVIGIKNKLMNLLKNTLIEEAYEVCQAIDNDDIDEMIEELGDILITSYIPLSNR